MQQNKEQGNYSEKLLQRKIQAELINSIANELNGLGHLRKFLLDYCKYNIEHLRDILETETVFENIRYTQGKLYAFKQIIRELLEPNPKR